MAAFNASCAFWANFVNVFTPPDIAAPPPPGTFIDLQWVDNQFESDSFRGFTQRRQSENKRVIRGDDGVTGAECFQQHGTLFWFDHIHVIPQKFALGTVLSTQERTYEVYNAFRDTTHTITSIIQTGVDGFSIVGDPSASPRIMPPLTGFIVIVNVEATGPVQINATVDYVFGLVGISKQVTFTGSRVIIMSQPPQSNITERWGWLTDIIEAASGDEQRISVRDVPRQQIVYRFAEEDNIMTFLQNQLWGWPENIWALPIWNDYTVLTADIAAGVSVVPVEDTAKRDFRGGDGELALIWQDRENFEAVEVSSFDATSLATAQPTLTSFTAGALVMPIRLSKFPGGYKVTNMNVAFRQAEVTWQVLNGRDFSLELSPNPAFDGGTYRGLPVWDIESDFLITRGTYRESEDKDIAVFPDKVGKFSTMTARDFPRNRIGGLSLEAFSRDEVWRLRALLHYFRGKQKSMWMSTSREDFRIESTQTATSIVINVEITNYSNLVFNAPDGARTRRNIEIKYIDGTKDFRRVDLSVLQPGLREVLTLDSGISQDASVANVERISFLVKRRMTVDDYALEHEFYEGEVTVPGIGFVDVYDGE